MKNRKKSRSKKETRHNRLLTRQQAGNIAQLQENMGSYVTRPHRMIGPRKHAAHTWLIHDDDACSPSGLSTPLSVRGRFTDNVILSALPLSPPASPAHCSELGALGLFRLRCGEVVGVVSAAAAVASSAETCGSNGSHSIAGRASSPSSSYRIEVSRDGESAGRTEVNTRVSI